MIVAEKVLLRLVISLTDDSSSASAVALGDIGNIY